MKKLKLFTPDQAHNISELILEMTVKALIRNEIGEAEKDAIINYTAQCEAFIKSFAEEGLIPKK